MSDFQRIHAMFSQQLTSWKGRASRIKLTSQVSFIVPIFIFDQSNNIFSSGLKGLQPKKSGALKLNDMFDIFKTIKGTPKYWQVAKN